MTAHITNLFSQLPPEHVAEEIVEVLAEGKDIRIERIISTGQVSPPGLWFDQSDDEWVAVIQGEAELEWEDGRRQTMRAGDWALIPAHKRHRVASSSIVPPCIWLAVFGHFNAVKKIQ